MNKKQAAKPKIRIALYCVGTAFLAFVAFLAFQAVAQAKARASRVWCVSYLKNLSGACSLWSKDHSNEFCFNVSTNLGGTLEFCDRDSNGFDRNAFRHFIVMSNELALASLLVCPSDQNRRPAKEFADLRPENITYLIRSGTNVNETFPQEIVAICPIHHNALMTDGSVLQLSAAGILERTR